MTKNNDNKASAAAIVRVKKLARIAELARNMRPEEQEKIIALLEVMKQNRSRRGGCAAGK